MFNLSEAYEALNGHTEFVVKVYDGKISFDYIVILPTSFVATKEEVLNLYTKRIEESGLKSDEIIQAYWNQAEIDVARYAAIRRNFRGVTFDEQTGEMLSLPLHKFFNVNQIPETQYDLIKHNDAVVYEKMDGTMIHFFLHNQKLHASTCRSSDNIFAKTALNLAYEFKINDLLVDKINNGYTPVFEFVAPTNQIVVKYNNPRLVYLISRNRCSGAYHFDLDFPDRTNQIQVSFGDIFTNIDQHTEFEGYVCHLPNMLVKVKTPWYNSRHRAVDALMKPTYKLYQVVFDGVMDDLIAMATENYKPALNAIYEEAQRDLLNEKIRIQQEYEEILAENSSFSNFDENPIANLKDQIDNIVEQQGKMAAIRIVSRLTGLSLFEAKYFVEFKMLPEEFVKESEKNYNLKKQQQIKFNFYKLAKAKYPDDLHVIVMFYDGIDPTQDIKGNLMKIYREKYPDKLYASFIEDA